MQVWKISQTPHSSRQLRHHRYVHSDQFSLTTMIPTFGPIIHLRGLDDSLASVDASAVEDECFWIVAPLQLALPLLTLAPGLDNAKTDFHSLPSVLTAPLTR